MDSQIWRSRLGSAAQARGENAGIGPRNPAQPLFQGSASKGPTQSAQQPRQVDNPFATSSFCRLDFRNKSRMH
jgi:hypothetical protein